MQVTSATSRWAETRPQDTAVVDTHRSLNWLEFQAHVDQLSGHLSGLGLRPGDRVGIAIPENADFIALTLAALRQGMVVVPMDWRSKAHEASVLADSFRLRAVISQSNKAGQTLHVPWPPRTLVGASVPEYSSSPADPALILLSSGTTGAASGAVVSHAALQARVEAGGSNAFPTAGNRYVSCLPLCFSMGLSMALRSIHAGNPTFIMPSVFGARELVRVVAEFQATYVSVVPTILRSLLQLGDTDLVRLKSLDVIRVSGSAMSPSEKRECAGRLGAQLIHGYGASAVGPVSHWTSRDPVEDDGCVGKPYDWIAIRIVDGEGRDVPAGQPGLLEIQSPTLASELLTQDGRVESLRDKWYAPGDVARVDDDGYLSIVGRATDVIIRGGVNVYPEMVEGAIRLHPSVADVAVVGRSDHEFGEIVVACVESRAPVTSGELLAHCRVYLSSKYQPDDVQIVDSLPRTASGKIQRGVLRKQLLAGNS